MKRNIYMGMLWAGLIGFVFGMEARADTNNVASLPFSEGFETGALAPYWTVTGTGAFRTQATTSNAPASGSYHLTMDDSEPGGESARNELTLAIDLSNRENVVLGFRAKGFGDEPDGPPPTPFTDGADFDGVAISANGVAWYEIQGLRSELTATYSHFSINLDAAVAALGLSYGPEFRIRFNQYDNYNIPSDGIAIDDISIAGDPADALKVIPWTDLSVSGHEGGPFSPTNQLYALANAGTSNLPWTATATASWISLAPASGMLAAGETNWVSVSIGSAANALPPGTFLEQVVFGNAATGREKARAVELEIIERKLDHFSWTPIGATQQVASAFDVEIVAMDQAGTRFPGFTNKVGLVGLLGTAPVLTSPTESGFFHAGSWTGSMTVAEAATNMLLRADDGNGHTGDSNPFTVNPKMLRVLIPSEASEGDGAIAGTVVANAAPALDLVVNLSSDDPSEATVDASATILAGQTTASFQLQIVDDSGLDGTQRATVSASAINYLDGAAEIQVHDNESATLTLSLPQTVSEDAGTCTGALLISPVPGEDIAIELTSDNPKIPGVGVILPAGQGLASFTLEVVDNNLIDGLQTATLSAQMQNWIGSQASVLVFDDEPAVIEVQLPANAMEGSGTLPGAGHIVLAGVATADLQVVLTSSDTSEITVPAFVTVPNGQSGATFDITMPDEEETDGMQSPSISAQTPGFVPGIAYIDILDDDLYGLTVGGVPSDQPVLEPISVDLAAVNIDGMPLTWFTGSVSLAASGDQGEVELSMATTPGFTAGQWSGNIAFGTVADNVALAADDGEGHTGTSSVFNVTGSLLATAPAILADTLVAAGQSKVRTLSISNLGNADLHFMIRGAMEDPVDGSLVAYYPFNGNTDDESGNGHDGIPHGATPTSDRFGQANSAYHFDGTGGYVDLGSLGGVKTVSMWVKPGLRDGYDTYFGHGDFRLYASGSENGQLILGDGSTWVETSVQMDSQLDEWVHLVAISDGTNSRVYFNGTDVSTLSGNLRAVTDGVANLGRMATGDPRLLNGDLDDIRIYNRVLSEAEIEALYHEGDDGLIARYPFDGDAADATGNGHGGTVHGATPTPDRFGNAGSAYLFDGTDDYIDIPDSPELRLGNTDFTIALWFNETARNPSYNDSLIAKRGAGHANGWFFSVAGSGLGPNAGKVVYLVSAGGDPEALSQAKVSLNEWHHSALTYDLASRTLSIYIDGLLDSTHANIPPPNPATVASMVIGRDSSSTSYAFHGSIDDLRIYGKKLSSADILELYGTGTASASLPAPAAATVSDVGLVAAFPFSGNANDESGNGHDGTVGGATPTADRFGNPNSAYRFDGVDDFIAVPDDPDLRLADTDFSIATWFNETERNPSYHGMLIAKRSGGYRNGWYHSVAGTASGANAGKTYYQVSGGADPSARSQSQVSLDEWHQSVVTYDLATQTLRFYIDGMLDSEHANMPPPNAATTAELMIGRDSSTSSYAFHGAIDDLRIYQRRLTDAEILVLYQEPAEVEIPWLAVNPKSGTVLPGATAAVSIRFDAAGLVAGDYSNAVLAVMANSALTPSNTVPVSMWVLPPAPSMLAEPEFTEGTTNEVAWNTVDGPVSYWAEVAADGGSAPLQDSGWISPTHHTFGGLSTGSVYYYRVKASAPGNGGLLESDWSGWVRSQQVADIADVDGDLMPNWWELAHFGGVTNALAADDPDGDGQGNLDEYIAGTNPTDPASAFFIQSFDSPTNGVFTLGWDAVTGRVYSIYWKTNLTGAFQVLETGILHPQDSYTDSIHNAESQGFYRIEVRLEP